MMKVAIVTGGSRGIGRAIVNHFLELNMRVYVCSKEADSLEKAKFFFEEKTKEVHFIQLDVTSGAEIEEVFHLIYDRNGRLDVLVNSAGISALSHLDDPQDIQIWSQLIGTNLTGTYLCARAAILKMKKNSWGRVINIASILGLRAMRNSSAYCASKHGVIGLTRAMALDTMEWNVTVNAICPGWVRSDMAKESMKAISHYYNIPPDRFEENELAAVPLGRWIEPDEVAQLAGYLVSDNAAAITGQAFEIAGGL